MSSKDYSEQAGSRRPERESVWQTPPLAQVSRSSGFEEPRTSFQWHNFRPVRPRLGELAIKAGLISQGPLDQFIRHQRNTGTRLGESLVSSGSLRARDLAHLLSIQSQSVFVDLEHDPIDPTLSNAIDLDHYIEHQYLPWRWVNRETVYVATDPDRVRGIIEARENRPCTIYVTTPKSIRRAVQERFSTVLNDRARLHLVKSAPESSAHKRFSLPQSVILCAFIVVIAMLFCVWPKHTMVGISLSFSLCFLSVSALKLMSILIGRRLREFEIPDIADQHKGNDESLPIYSILVPLFREAAVLPILTDALSRLDYPAAKLQILLIFEESDQATIAAAKALKLPDSIELFVFPIVCPSRSLRPATTPLISRAASTLLSMTQKICPNPTSCGARSLLSVRVTTRWPACRPGSISIISLKTG